MEPRTETDTAASAATEHHDSRQTTKKPAAKRPARKSEEDGSLLRAGKRIIQAISIPAGKVWEERLREPVAKGLITAGAVLTATGRMILDYGGGHEKETAHAPRAHGAAGKQALH